MIKIHRLDDKDTVMGKKLKGSNNFINKEYSESLRYTRKLLPKRDTAGERDDIALFRYDELIVHKCIEKKKVNS